MLKLHLEGIAAELEGLRDEERAAFDNLSESLQNGERGQKMEAASDTLDEIASELTEQAVRLDEAAE